MKIESKYKLRIVKNGKSFYGEVILEIESISGLKEHQIIENYQGKGFQSQGYVETIPKEGYDSWKQGIKNGIIYGLKLIIDDRKFNVTILEANGLTTDTNPIILAFVAARALLDKIENKESKTEVEKLEELVYSSWNHGFDSQIDFENLTIEGN